MTTTPLPEPDLFDGITHSPSGRFTATVNGYTAGKMHAHAAAECAARDAEIERLRADAARVGNLLVAINMQLGNGFIPWEIEDAYAEYEQSVSKGKNHD